MRDRADLLTLQVSTFIVALGEEIKDAHWVSFCKQI